MFSLHIFVQLRMVLKPQLRDADVSLKCYEAFG